MANTCLQVRGNPILADLTKNLTSSSSSLTFKYAGGPLLPPKAIFPETLSYREDLGTWNSSAALLIVHPSETALQANFKSSSDHCLKGTLQVCTVCLSLARRPGLESTGWDSAMKSHESVHTDIASVKNR